MGYAMHVIYSICDICPRSVLVGQRVGIYYTAVDTSALLEFTQCRCVFQVLAIEDICFPRFS